MVLVGRAEIEAKSVSRRGWRSSVDVVLLQMIIRTYKRTVADLEREPWGVKRESVSRAGL